MRGGRDGGRARALGDAVGAAVGAGRVVRAEVRGERGCMAEDRAFQGGRGRAWSLKHSSSCASTLMASPSAPRVATAKQAARKRASRRITAEKLIDMNFTYFQPLRGDRQRQ